MNKQNVLLFNKKIMLKGSVYEMIKKLVLGITLVASLGLGGCKNSANSTSSSSNMQQSIVSESSSKESQSKSNETSQSVASSTNSVQISETEVVEYSETTDSLAENIFTEDDAIQILKDYFVAQGFSLGEVGYVPFKQVDADYIIKLVDLSVVKQGGTGTAGFYRVSENGNVQECDTSGNPY